MNKSPEYNTKGKGEQYLKLGGNPNLLARLKKYHFYST